jgi:transcription elongation factor Elf1
MTKPATAIDEIDEVERPIECPKCKNRGVGSELKIFHDYRFGWYVLVCGRCGEYIFKFEDH